MDRRLSLRRWNIHQLRVPYTSIQQVQVALLSSSRTAIRRLSIDVLAAGKLDLKTLISLLDNIGWLSAYRYRQFDHYMVCGKATGSIHCYRIILSHAELTQRSRTAQRAAYCDARPRPSRVSGLLEPSKYDWSPYWIAYSHRSCMCRTCGCEAQKTINATQSNSQRDLGISPAHISYTTLERKHSPRSDMDPFFFFRGSLMTSLAGDREVPRCATVHQSDY